MQYIEAVSDVKAKNDVKVFLGGGITGVRNWQKDMVKAIEGSGLKVTVFNPRRENFPMDDPNAAEEQITWEHRKLREANVNIFWFSKETLCPIVLWELASALERGQPQDTRGPGTEWRNPTIIVGMDEEYKRRQDVEIQTKLMDPEVEIHIGFESFSAAVVRILGRLDKDNYYGNRKSMHIDQGTISTVG
jgi:hypothetical protein